MQSPTVAFVVLSLLACAGRAAAYWLPATNARLQLICGHSREPVALRDACVRLRGGAEGNDEDDEEEDMETEDGASEVCAGLDNPYLDESGGVTAPGMGPAGAGLEFDDLASTLQNPEAMQQTLKMLQDPEAMKRVKAMMEDPEFQKSLQQYVQQITADPKFQTLRDQTEKMLEQPEFMEQMSKAFSEMGGMAEMTKAFANIGADTLGGKTSDATETDDPFETSDEE